MKFTFPRPAAIRRRARLALAVAILLFSSALSAVVSATPANAQFAEVLGGDSYDWTCMIGTGQAAWLWDNSLIYGIGVYIGGVDALAYSAGECPYQNNNVSASALATDMSDGWGLAFIWVGYQDPGTGYANEYTTGSQATADGESDAEAAAAKMCSLNLCGSDGPIYADVEGYGGAGNATNLTLAELYVNGWSYELDQVQGFESGVYGSICGSAIDDYKNHSNVPDYIWPAWYNSASATTTMDLASPGCSPAIPNNNWDHDQRIVQWAENVPLNVDGNTYYVDYDCSLGGATGINDFQPACQGKQGSY